MQIKKAFTLIEILLAMGLLAAVAAFVVPIFNTFQTGNDIKVAADITVQALRRSRSIARSGEEDSNWGVFIQTGSVTIFKGDSYATRDAAYDELYSINQNISNSGVNEVVFAKFSGDPSPSGTISLSLANGEAWNITLSPQGTIDY